MPKSIKMSGRLRRVGAGMTGLVAALLFGNDFFRLLENDAPSRSHGSVSDGSLENGKRMPTRGENFRTHSHLTAVLGRNSMHSTVRDICLAAYEELAESGSEQTFVYGEAGWPSGGKFPPHKTHQNGLAVDFMVPVLRAGSGRPARLPTHPFNLNGYALDFDSDGSLGGLKVDFDAMANHLLALRAAAEDQQASISLVILAPDLQPHLFKTQHGKQLQRALRFNTKQAWVRHDEHYHVVFAL